MNDRFAAYCDRLGLPAALSPHCLRHSYVSHLVEDGIDPLFVQQQVGHYAGDRCQEASWSRRVRRPSNTFCRPTWPLAAASSRWRCSVGLNSIVVTKKVHDSQMDSK